MNETIVMPSAVTVAVAALEAGLPGVDYSGVPVVGSVPDPRPARFVRVIRTGGQLATLVSDAAQITVEAWASDDVASVDLAEACRAVMHSLPGTVVLTDIGDIPVYRVDEFSGPVNLPDPVSAQSRHTFTLQLHVRGRAV